MEDNVIGIDDVDENKDYDDMKITASRDASPPILRDIGIFFRNLGTDFAQLSSLLGAHGEKQAIKGALYDVEASLVGLKDCIGSDFCDCWMDDEEAAQGDKTKMKLLHPMVLPCEDGSDENWRQQKEMSGYAHISYKICVYYEDNSGGMFDILCRLGRYIYQVRSVMDTILEAVTGNQYQSALLELSSLMCDTLKTSGNVAKLLANIMGDH